MKPVAAAAVLPDAARTLLTALFPDAVMTDPLRINLRGLVHGGTPDDVVSRFVPSVNGVHTNGYASECLMWNREQNRSVYVAPGLRRGAIGTKDGVAALTAFWVDLDAKDFMRAPAPLAPVQRAEGERLALERLRERLPLTLQPSILVDTGGGLQCWWLFKEPAWVGDDGYTVETLEGHLKGLATALGGDPAVTHLAALMRLPGFANRKYADGPLATILAADLARRFNPGDFADYFVEIPPKAPRLADATDGPLGPLAPVLTTCGFLQWCRDHPADVREPLWYAMCSNLVRLQGGRAAAHEFSRGHPGYAGAETDRKLDHALAASGPISCAKIRELGFPGCPADGHGVTSPAGLAWVRPRSTDTAETRATGWPLYDGSAAWEFPAVSELISELLPAAGVVWWGGLPKRYKSLFALYVSLAIACRRSQLAKRFLVQAFPRILYVAREDGGPRLQERKDDILSAWTERPEPGAIVFVIRPALDLLQPDHLAWLRETCLKLGATMLWLDTWTALSPSADPLGTHDQARLAARVVKLCEDIGGLVVVVDHSRKNRPEGQPLSSADIFGPPQKWAAAEHIVMLDVVDAGRRLEVFVEGKDLETRRFFLTVTPRGSGTEKFAYAGSVEDVADAQRQVGEQNRQAVLAILQAARSPLSTGDLVERLREIGTPLARDTVLKHVQALIKAGTVRQIGDGRTVRYAATVPSSEAPSPANRSSGSAIPRQPVDSFADPTISGNREREGRNPR